MDMTRYTIDQQSHQLHVRHISYNLLHNQICRYNEQVHTKLFFTFSISTMIWLVIWFFLLIFVTTINKVFFSSMNCPYPICITLV